MTVGECRKYCEKITDHDPPRSSRRASIHSEAFSVLFSFESPKSDDRTRTSKRPEIHAIVPDHPRRGERLVSSANRGNCSFFFVLFLLGDERQSRSKRPQLTKSPQLLECSQLRTDRIYSDLARVEPLTMRRCRIDRLLGFVEFPRENTNYSNATSYRTRNLRIPPFVEEFEHSTK